MLWFPVYQILSRVGDRSSYHIAPQERILFKLVRDPVCALPSLHLQLEEVEPCRRRKLVKCRGVTGGFGAAFTTV